MKGIFILFIVLISIGSLLVYARNHPVGISAHNGPIYTDAVLGFANITSLGAYNSSFNQAPYGASLQLNVVDKVVTPTNTYYLWFQDVAYFLTNNDTMNFGDNIWNFTLPYANVSNVIGEGEISVYNTSYHQTYYAAGWYISKYYFPFAFYLLINETYNNSGVEVDFAYMHS
ncbi:thermopsin family protease [Sulfolobus tengchongensis]|uniref:Thermopsin family protease n=1 Tax=Sulfolobus tengchongensis TaxID=207809 RepID=A0AAX4L1S6_9CREN